MTNEEIIQRDYDNALALKNRKMQEYLAAKSTSRHAPHESGFVVMKGLEAANAEKQLMAMQLVRGETITIGAMSIGSVLMEVGCYVDAMAYFSIVVRLSPTRKLQSEASRLYEEASDKMVAAGIRLCTKYRKQLGKGFTTQLKQLQNL